ncbi:hypothetical protein Tco_0075576, partial [Tanacetum coccineum]
MSHPLSPDHAADIPEVEPEEEELEEEEIEEEEQEEMDSDDKIDEAKVISPYDMIGSQKTPPPKPDISSDSESDGLSRQMGIRAETKFSKLKRLNKGHRFIKGLNEDLRNEIQHDNMVEHRVTTLENQVQSLVQQDIEKGVRRDKIEEEGPSEAVDVLATFGKTPPHEPHGSP